MSERRDPWDVAGERWAGISANVRARYRDIVGEDGPDEDDIRQSLETLGEAARAVADSIGAAMRDPETRDQLKKVSSSIASAVGATLSQFGEELRNPRTDPRSPTPSDIAEEPDTAREEE